MQFLLNRHNSGVGSPRFLGYGGCMRKPLSGSGDHAAFLNALRAIAAAEQDVGLDALDYADRAMLYHIALSEEAGKRLRVTDFDSHAFGTLPTVLARVSRLIEAGWVEKEVNPNDARSRVVSTSSYARKCFQKASRSLKLVIGR